MDDCCGNKSDFRKLFLDLVMISGYMRKIDIYVCPSCISNDFLLSNIVKSNSEIKNGILICRKCKAEFPIDNYIPRFVSSGNYAQSFGFQWNKYARAQIDR